jgi:hypothetical protein
MVLDLHPPDNNITNIDAILILFIIINLLFYLSICQFSQSATFVDLDPLDNCDAP